MNTSLLLSTDDDVVNNIQLASGSNKLYLKFTDSDDQLNKAMTSLENQASGIVRNNGLLSLATGTNKNR